jgi:hypothetical protein
VLLQGSGSAANGVNAIAFDRATITEGSKMKCACGANYYDGESPCHDVCEKCRTVLRDYNSHTRAKLCDDCVCVECNERAQTEYLGLCHRCLDEKMNDE